MSWVERTGKGSVGFQARMLTYDSEGAGDRTWDPGSSGDL